MRDLFIYYRIDVANAPLALAAAQAMQHRLREKHPQLAVRLLRRPDEPASPTTPTTPQTWMETYSLPGTGITPELQAEIEQAASELKAYIVGERHTEIFVPCAS